MARVLNMAIKSSPDLVAVGHRRIWTKVIRLGGAPYAKIDGRLVPVIYSDLRNVWVALDSISIHPTLARFLT